MNYQGSVLILDDNKAFMRTRALFLTRAGYTVYQASTAVEAEDILARHWIQLLLIDVRLKDDSTNINDKSGVEFAVRDDLKHIPKIIMTAYPNFDDMRDVLHTLADEPVALDYLDKAKPASDMVAAVHQVFDKFGEQIDSAEIQWQSTSAIQLVEAVLGEQSVTDIVERIRELEMVLKTAFKDSYKRVVLKAWGQPCSKSAHLLAYAFSENLKPQLYFVHCSAEHQITQNIRSSYARIFPTAKNATDAFTMRFGIFAHSLSGFGEDLTIATYNQLVNIYSAETCCHLLQHTLERKLPKLHGNPIQSSFTLIEQFQLGTFEAYDAKRLALMYQARLCGLIGQSKSFAEFEETDWAQWHIDASKSLLTGTIHGNLSGHTIIFNAEREAWLIDFAAVQKFKPLLLDYVRLACNLRFNWSTQFSLDEWEQFEQFLLNNETSTPAYLDERFAKQANILATIQRIAIKSTKCDDKMFHLGVILCLIQRVVAFDPAKQHPVVEIHQLIRIAASLDALVKKQPTRSAISEKTLNFNEGLRQLVIYGDVKELTPGEFDLFVYFYAHRNQVVSRIDIAQEVYKVDITAVAQDDAEIIDYQRINTMVNRLRQKIEPTPKSPQFLKTIRSKGYCLEWLDETDSAEKTSSLQL